MNSTLNLAFTAAAAAPPPPNKHTHTLSLSQINPPNTTDHQQVTGLFLKQTPKDKLESYQKDLSFDNTATTTTTTTTNTNTSPVTIDDFGQIFEEPHFALEYNRQVIPIYTTDSNFESYLDKFPTSEETIAIAKLVSSVYALTPLEDNNLREPAIFIDNSGNPYIGHISENTSENTSEKTVIITHMITRFDNNGIQNISLVPARAQIIIE